MIKVILSFLLACTIIWSHPAPASTVVAYDAVAFEMVPTSYCIKALADNLWALQCGNTGASIGTLNGIIPPGLGNTFRIWVEYSTPDEGANKICKAALSIVSEIQSCLGGSVPGIACRADTPSVCTGGTCTGAIEGSIASPFFSVATATATHDDIKRYITAFGAATTVQRYNDNTNVTVDCSGNECNATPARYWVHFYSSGSTATRCDYYKIWIEFI